MKRIPVYLLAAIISCCAACSNTDNEMKLFPVKSGGQEGYVDREGKMVITPQFKEAWFFNDGVALVKASNSLVGFIDEAGKYVVNPQYQEATPFNDGLAATAQPDSPINYIDTKGAVKLRVPFADEAGVFSEGLASFKQGDKMGYIDKSGAVVITPQFHVAGYFSEGLAMVVLVGKDEKWQCGYIDNKGVLKIGYQFAEASSFHEGLAQVKSGDLCGYIDKTGKFAINPQFADAWDFVNGYAMIRQDSKYGFIDKTGKIVINPQFTFLSAFSANGMATAAIGEGDEMKFGYIDKKGAWVINPQFAAASDFSGGTAFAGNSRISVGIIDNKGGYKVNPQFELESYAFYSNTVISRSRVLMIRSGKNSPWSIAEHWLNAFYHMQYDKAVALSTDETKKLLGQLREFAGMMQDSTKQMIMRQQVTVKHVATDGDKAHVLYTLSDAPERDYSIDLLKVDNKWLVAFTKDQGRASDERQDDQGQADDQSYDEQGAE